MLIFALNIRQTATFDKRQNHLGPNADVHDDVTGAQPLPISTLSNSPAISRERTPARRRQPTVGLRLRHSASVYFRRRVRWCVRAAGRCSDSPFGLGSHQRASAAVLKGHEFDSPNSHGTSMPKSRPIAVVAGPTFVRDNRLERGLEADWKLKHRRSPCLERCAFDGVTADQTHECGCASTQTAGSSRR